MVHTYISKKDTPVNTILIMQNPFFRGNIMRDKTLSQGQDKRVRSFYFSLQMLAAAHTLCIIALCIILWTSTMGLKQVWSHIQFLFFDCELVSAVLRSYYFSLQMLAVAHTLCIIALCIIQYTLNFHNGSKTSVKSHSTFVFWLRACFSGP